MTSYLVKEINKSNEIEHTNENIEHTNEHHNAL